MAWTVSPMLDLTRVHADAPADCAELRRHVQRSILWQECGCHFIVLPTTHNQRQSEGKGPRINADALARAIAHIAWDAKATDVVVLGIRDLTTIADYFVICTADNERQMRAIQRDIDEGMGEQGVPPRRVEGTADSGWILMDFGDVIAHIFSKEERLFYSLDKLWSAAQPVLVIQ